MSTFAMKPVLPHDDDDEVIAARKNRFNEGFLDGARSFNEGLDREHFPESAPHDADYVNGFITGWEVTADNEERECF